MVRERAKLADETAPKKQQEKEEGKQEPVPETQQQQTPPPAAQPNILLKIKGNGSKSSETITIENKTYFTYSYISQSSNSGAFYAYLVPDGQSWDGDNAIQIVSTSAASVKEDETLIRASKGNYYIHIEAVGDWGFVVDKR